jgi:hypothetical protein
MTTATFTQTATAQKAGQYNPTSIDAAKTEVDFRITQVAPFYIRWKSGEGQTVTARQLAKLQTAHTWKTDF